MKRLNNSNVTSKHLAPKFQIGSVHGRLNFESEECAFQQTDIPEAKRQARLDVIRGSRPNVLTSSKRWNASVSIGDNSSILPGNQISAYDQSTFQYNFRAECLPEKLPKYVPKPSKMQLDHRKIAEKEGLSDLNFDRSKLILKRVQEMPIHPKLIGKIEWDKTVSVNRRKVTNQGQELGAKAKKNSQKQKSYLLAHYKSPLQIEEERMNRLRKEKEDRLNGVKVKTPIDDVKISESRALTKNSDTEIHSHRKKLANRKYREYYNDGVWEYSKIEGCFVWSCSMNPNRDFRGSSYRVRNPDAWNFASP